MRIKKTCARTENHAFFVCFFPFLKFSSANFVFACLLSWVSCVTPCVLPPRTHWTDMDGFCWQIMRFTCFPKPDLDAKTRHANYFA